MNIATALGYAVTIINGSEGFSPKAFLDTLPKPPVWTIGHGTTRVNGRPVMDGMVCTKAQADLWAMADMTDAAHFVLKCVKVPLNDWQLAAMVSFCYNVGATKFLASSVVEALNLALYQVAANRLLEYDHAGGVEVKGLETRRGRERALFLIGLGIYVASALPGRDKLDYQPGGPAPARPPTPVEADDLNAIELTRINGADPATTT